MLVDRIKRAINKYNFSDYFANRRITEQYTTELVEFKRRHLVGDVEFAVVIHLFYTDNWPLFKRKLEHLQQISKFDLFITLPRNNVGFIDTIRRDFPNVEYLICPNKGRDVLPFIVLAQALDAFGYKEVLKFHSKKSTHWDGGDEWLRNTLDQLIPDDDETLRGIIQAIQKDDTGVIGAADYYYPLTINFPANGKHMSAFVLRHYGKSAERHFLQECRAEYGFFGGTMLWARIDAIKRVIVHSEIVDFETEQGQIDGTYAHAVERLLCLIPEIDNKTNYESNGRRVKQRPYKSSNIPEWSRDHDK